MKKTKLTRFVFAFGLPVLLILMMHASLSAQDFAFRQGPNPEVVTRTSSSAEDRSNALKYFNQGKYKKAIQAFNELLNNDSRDYELYGKRGIAYFWDNQPRRAMADFDIAINKAPKADYYFYRAGLLPDSEFKSKIADYNKAIKLDKTQGRFFYERGVLKLRVFEQYLKEKPASKPVNIRSLEKEMGLKFDVCQDMARARTNDIEFTKKSKQHCKAYATALQK